MKLWHTIRCRTNSHRPAPHRIGWDGAYYRGTCRHCGAAIIRVRHGKWCDFATRTRHGEGQGFSGPFARSRNASDLASEAADQCLPSPSAPMKPRNIQFEYHFDDPPWER